MLIDCHAHVYEPQFDAADLPAVFANAAAANVAAIVAVCERQHDARQVLSLSDRFRHAPAIAPAIGLHPVQPASACRAVHSVALEELPAVEQLIRAHCERLVCVGEIGLDFSKHVLSSTSAEAAQQRAVQLEVFGRQIRLANSLGLPVNVHSRSAGHYAIEALLQNGCTAALLHAFDGKASYAAQAAQAGYYFSVPPCVARSPQLRRLVEALPLDRLVLESDSPALAPEKGAVNEPANVAVSAAQVALIKGVPLAEVEAVTTANALRLFPRLGSLLDQR